MLRLGLFAITLGLSGCFIMFGDGDSPDVCALAETDAEPEIAPAPLRNPDNLSCESFGGGCNAECGPCPAANFASLTTPTKPTPPLPSWNYCGHRCESLSESTCSTDPECRVVKDARCNVSLDCETDFIGCFPTDTAPAAATDCFQIFDGWECSRDNACTAMHYGVGGAPREEPQTRPFAMCVPEGKSPGQCWSETTCDRVAPACPTGTTPGIENSCYTGGCIPLDICEPRT